ncbi:MAG: hypothetical protein VKL23_04820 [Cyanobacteriota bacterium]|jgi:hypothetical protein|nr:hypothetical protein [Cyanobacteriota bacterium]
MDLAIAVVNCDARLIPLSVHGLLWLQTHFETSQWDSLCSGRARLHTDGVNELCRDARDAGLQVTRATA